MSKIFPAMLLAGALIATPAGAQIFSDNFQTAGNPVATTPSKWASNVYGVVGAAPVGGGNALYFTNGNSGQDLVSQQFTMGPGSYRLTVDYYCATPYTGSNASGCGGYVGLFPGGSTTTVPSSGDGWLATDNPNAYATPFLLMTGANGFSTNTFNFQVTTGGTFGLKFEDFSGISGGQGGDAFFRNLSLSGVPEPSTWALLILGFGATGAAMRRRRAPVRAGVRFA